jgi:hypothetical protein
MNPKHLLFTISFAWGFEFVYEHILTHPSTKTLPKKKNPISKSLFKIKFIWTIPCKTNVMT